jgi:hypothetical protein
MRLKIWTITLATTLASSLFGIWSPNAYAIDTAGSLVGNSSSQKFHLANCEFALIMRKNKRVWFSSVEDALGAQMKPCCWCFPIFEAKVEGRVILPSTNNAPDPNTCTEGGATVQTAKTN